MPGKSKARQALEADIIAHRNTANAIWHPAFRKRATEFAMLGASNQEIAAFLGCTEQTFEQWVMEKPGLRAALSLGRERADVRVVRSLHRRALGYDLKDVQTKRDGKGQVIETVEKKRHVPASDAAINLWLTNRRPQQWRDRGAASGDVQVNLLAIVEASLDKRSGEPKVIEAEAPSAIADAQVVDKAGK